jgi:hypothetical protein
MCVLTVATSLLLTNSLREASMKIMFLTSSLQNYRKERWELLRGQK